jgi:uncharacterized protein (DUF2062 family)
MMKSEENNILKFFKVVYAKLVKINDTDQKIALGFGIGVFCGIMPTTGPLAALFLAFILRINRASALLGSLLTNTWLSFATFILSIKVGSVIMKVSWQDVRQDWLLFLYTFKWQYLFKLSVLKLILPVIIGYFLIALVLGLSVYLITLLILKRNKTCKLRQN